MSQYHASKLASAAQEGRRISTACSKLRLSGVVELGARHVADEPSYRVGTVQTVLDTLLFSGDPMRPS